MSIYNVNFMTCSLIYCLLTLNFFLLISNVAGKFDVTFACFKEKVLNI